MPPASVVELLASKGPIGLPSADDFPIPAFQPGRQPVDNLVPVGKQQMLIGWYARRDFGFEDDLLVGGARDQPAVESTVRLTRDGEIHKVLGGLGVLRILNDV